MHGAHDIFPCTTSEGIPFRDMSFCRFWGPGPGHKPKMALGLETIENQWSFQKPEICSDLRPLLNGDILKTRQMDQFENTIGHILRNLPKYNVYSNKVTKNTKTTNWRRRRRCIFKQCLKIYYISEEF